VQALLKFITRKSRGGIAVKEQTVDAEVLLAGRGNDCGIHLPDARVLLNHAEFSVRRGDIYVAPAPAADIRVNGNIATMSRLNIGDVTKVGPYDVTLEANDQHGNITLTIELVTPLDDDLNRILAQAQIRTGRYSIRAISWGLALVIALTAFAAPWIASFFHEPTPEAKLLDTSTRQAAAAPTRVWSTGSISAAHKFFGDSCETCHTAPFIPVRDETCLSCHSGIQHHADPAKFPFASLEGRACQSCHKEHQGNRTIVLSNQAFCVDCHGDIKNKAPDSEFSVVADFGSSHPEFRPTLVIDAALHETSRAKPMDAMPPPQEDSSLDFPHARHMREIGVRDPVRGNVKLECVSCHKVEAGGGYMMPISFDKHCHQCHQLKFDTFVPDRELVHGHPEDMLKQVRDVYDAVALRGGYEEPSAPGLVRRRPGTPLTAEQKKQVLDWSAAKTEAILNGRFGKGQCDSCHKLFDAPSGGPTGAGWGVEPVSAANVWFPKSTFRHVAHRDVDCGTCHAAKESVASADVLMPSIKTCQACHGGENATNKVPSTCISCHGFHRSDLDELKTAAPASPHANTANP
jgi:predicted CXXCH cytochrome family protein